MSKENNHMSLRFDAISVNEAFARMAAAAFLMELDPTMEELDDVKTAVSEAVTNAIIHGYPGGMGKSTQNMEIPQVEMICTYEGRKLTVIVRDWGVGIADIAQARQPFYTDKPELERSGMGFAFMEAFMDELQVESAPQKGTCVKMTKLIGRETSEGISGKSMADGAEEATLPECGEIDREAENTILPGCVKIETELNHTHNATREDA